MFGYNLFYQVQRFGPWAQKGLVLGLTLCLDIVNDFLNFF